MERNHINAENVIIIDEAFYMPELDRTRRIWLYKPPFHDDVDKRFPVIYMHDGQNLFDEATAFGEEWGVDETLNSMLAECIIVGIDNSERRMTEYNFHDHEEYGPGEGRKYVEFIVNTLKPYVDANFKTIPEREHTYISGSSMGGLISVYGAIHYAETFGGAGVFSPALWLTPNVKDELKDIIRKNVHLPQRFYFYGGAQEGSNMLTHIYELSALLKEFSHYSVMVEVDHLGEHSEAHWRQRFPNFYKWLAEGSGAEVFETAKLIET